MDRPQVRRGRAPDALGGERAQAERERVEAICRRLQGIAEAGGAADAAIGELQQASARIGAELGDILLAQDFHDLTGQVINRVVQLAATIEEQLLALLLQSAPTGAPGQDKAYDMSALQGPVVDAEGRTDVVADQKDVDDLLASLGF